MCVCIPTYLTYNRCKSNNYTVYAQLQVTNIRQYVIFRY